MRQKSLLLTLLLLSAFSGAWAQGSRYVVQFRDKGSNTFMIANPSAYLSARSIARRTRYGIAIDSTDLPVTQRYLDSIRSVPNVTILNASKWLNSVSIRTTDAAALTRIQAFPFVQSAVSVSTRIAAPAGPGCDKLAQPLGDATMARVETITADQYNYGQSAAQVRIHNGNFLHNIGLHGEGMIIGMLDAGYQNYLTLNSLDSVRNAGQILGTWDFVVGETSVNEDNAHGVECFSTIAANRPGTFVGTAFKASYYLYRTEDAATETPIEEHNWVCGAERVDSAGGDLISSSLGYYSFDAPFTAQSHPFSDMDGNTTTAAIGADLAAKKGILIANAAGNEGSNSWGRIITPADGDSVLAVGAVNSAGVPANFTSRGPSADGQVKPDVASVGVGTIIQYPGGAIAGGNGTSFATPNLAGLVTCLWQGFPEKNNMDIIGALRAAGSRASNPNDTIGYGIPDVRLALIRLTKTVVTSSVTQTACKAIVSWTSKDVASMRYELQRNVPGQTGYTTVFSTFGNGATFGNLRSYQYGDTLVGVPAGTITYRVVQYFDTSVASPASDIIATQAIPISAACSGTGITAPGYSDNSLRIVPNPAHNTASLRINFATAAPDLVVTVTDATGKLIYRKSQAVGAGSSYVPLPVAGWPAGKYFIAVYAGGRLAGTRELVKL